MNEVSAQLREPKSINSLLKSLTLSDETNEKLKYLEEFIQLLKFCNDATQRKNDEEEIDCGLFINCIQFIMKSMNQNQDIYLKSVLDSQLTFQEGSILCQLPKIIEVFDYQATLIDLSLERRIQFYSYSYMTKCILTTSTTVVFRQCMESKLPHKLLLLLLINKDSHTLDEYAIKLEQIIFDIYHLMIVNDECRGMLGGTEYGWIQAVVVLLQSDSIRLPVKLILLDTVYQLAKDVRNKRTMMNEESNLLAYFIVVLQSETAAADNNSDSIIEYKHKVLSILWELSDILENKLLFASEERGILKPLVNMLQEYVLQKEVASASAAAAELIEQICGIFWYLTRCKENIQTIFHETHALGIFHLLIGCIQKKNMMTSNNSNTMMMIRVHSLACAWNIAYYTPNKPILRTLLPTFLSILTNMKPPSAAASTAYYKAQFNALSIIWNMANDVENKRLFVVVVIQDQVEEEGEEGRTVLSVLTQLVMYDEGINISNNVVDADVVAIRIRALDTIRKLATLKENKIKFGQNESHILTVLIDMLHHSQPLEICSKALGTLRELTLGSLNNQIALAHEEIGLIVRLKGLIMFDDPIITNAIASLLATTSTTTSNSSFAIMIDPEDDELQQQEEVELPVATNCGGTSLKTLQLAVEIKMKAFAVMWNLAIAHENKHCFIYDKIFFQFIFQNILFNYYFKACWNNALGFLKCCLEHDDFKLYCLQSTSRILDILVALIVEQSSSPPALKDVIQTNYIVNAKTTLKIKVQAIFCLMMISELINFQVIITSTSDNTKQIMNCRMLLTIVGQELNTRINQILQCEKTTQMSNKLQSVIESIHILTCAKLAPEVITIISQPTIGLFATLVQCFKTKYPVKRLISSCFWNSMEDALSQQVMDNIMESGVYDLGIKYLLASEETFSTWDKTQENFVSCLMNYFSKLSSQHDNLKEKKKENDENVEGKEANVAKQQQSDDAKLKQKFVSVPLLIAMIERLLSSSVTIAGVTNDSDDNKMNNVVVKEQSKKNKQKLSAKHKKVACLYISLLNYHSAGDCSNNVLSADLLNIFVPEFVTILQYILENKSTSDVVLGAFALPLILKVFQTLLTINEKHYGELLSRYQTIPLIIQVIALFSRNAPQIRLCGGGGKDVESASLAIDVLQLLLPYVIPALRITTSPEAKDDQASPQQPNIFSTEEISSLTELLLQLSGNHKLPLSSRNVAKALGDQLCTVLQIYQSSPIPNISPSSSKPNQQPIVRKHVMISYCWHPSANPQFVKQLTTHLRQQYGIDVWRDEEGSSLVPSMLGASIDERMAEAIQHSDTMIICVSMAYKDSTNCKLECNYASVMAKRGLVKILFVMMNEEYTTVSFPKFVDGWLGLVVGTSLWLGMWKEDMISQVAKSISEQVGSCSFLPSSPSTSSSFSFPILQAAPLPPIIPAIIQKDVVLSTASSLSTSSQTTQQQPTKISVFSSSKSHNHQVEDSSASLIIPAVSVSSPSVTPASPLFAAWEVLQRATNKQTPRDHNSNNNNNALISYLEEVGIEEMQDLEFCDEDICIHICKCLKLVQQKAFLVYMARFRQQGNSFST